jgi:CspA family cold shock protein
MKTGVIRFYNRMHGWGIAVPSDLSDDVFIHFSAIVGRKYLREGQRISYELGEYKGRVVARNVEVIEDVPARPTGNSAEHLDALAMLGATKAAVAK